jgi:hypothetical protein
MLGVAKFPGAYVCPAGVEPTAVVEFPAVCEGPFVIGTSVQANVIAAIPAQIAILTS